MIKSYFKVAFRNIIGNKVYSAINITGLAIGIACFILILFWVWSELSYDNFYKNKDDIYRVQVSQTVDGNTFNESDTPYLLANEIKAKIPEVKYSSIYLPLPKFVVKSEGKSFYEEGIRVGGTDFFSLFSFEFIHGNANTALSNPGSIVITESMAIKYYGNIKAIGKVIQIDGMSYTVSGIIEDVSELTHLKFDFMIDPYIVESKYKEILNWNNFIARNYVQLKQGSDQQTVAEKINSVILKNFNSGDVGRFKVEFVLQSLGDVYLTPSISKYIYILSLLAVLILFIASMNYVNLSTAISIKRLKEVGIRKVVGSDRIHLIKQFLAETFVLTLVASCLAIIIDVLLLPAFNELTGKNISIDFFGYQFLLVLAAIIIVTGFLAGGYPAFYISSFQPIKILNRSIHAGSKSNRLKRFLVISQYAISIGLIICTLIISGQVNYMKNKNLGFDKNNIIYLPIAGDLKEKYDLVKNELSSNPNIHGVAASFYLPIAEGRDRCDIEWVGKNPNQILCAETPKIDYDFFELLGIDIVTGRNFSKEFSTDAEEALIINEETAKQTKMKSPIGEVISMNDRKGKIIGIVKDANFLSLKYNVEPQVFTLLKDVRETIRGVVLIKMRAPSAEEISRTISFIEDIWKKFNPDEPFEFHFWNESLEQQYTSEQTISKLFSYFSILAVLISCLGLFGLVSLLVQQRKKEIGIRKVIGASVYSILLLVIKELLKWVVIANIIAWPVAYYFMRRWLDDFAYRIDMTVWIFIFSGGIALLIALLTVSYQAIKAATVNPVDSLKYE